MKLTSQVALVTGAGAPDGIGMAVARMLASDGATVVLTSTTARVLQRVVELTAERLVADGVVADLMTPGEADRVVAHTLERFGRLDICVNNAGMTAVGTEAAGTSSLPHTSDATWREGIERNLSTCFAVTRAAIAAMLPRGYGRVVNVASTSGPLQAFVGDVAYHAAKAGVVGFTRAAALEVASAGITVNAVAPGWISTGSQTAAEVVAGSRSPLRRSGTPHEVAAAIRFLADPDASYITGQLLVVDGGNSLPEDRSWTP